MPKVKFVKKYLQKMLYKTKNFPTDIWEVFCPFAYYIFGFIFLSSL